MSGYHGPHADAITADEVAIAVVWAVCMALPVIVAGALVYGLARWLGRRRA